MAQAAARDGAFGRPGIEPRWTRSAKDAVGTAYASSSKVWFTTSAGVLNEVYYPTIDRPQIRDLLVRAMEWFANGAGLLPEQVWDEKLARPEQGLSLGRPTGSAMPLMWAHAEYVRLLRSVVDGVPFDRISAVADRYLSGPARPRLEIWKFNRQARGVPAGTRLRIQTAAPFRLRWTRDDWATQSDTAARATRLGVHYADLDAPPEPKGPLRFTFYWTDAQRWEGRDFAVGVHPVLEQ